MSRKPLEAEKQAGGQNGSDRCQEVSSVYWEITRGKERSYKIGYQYLKLNFSESLVTAESLGKIPPGIWFWNVEGKCTFSGKLHRTGR